jgi:DNA-binding HxlR family transcriptional regulator
MPAAGVKVDEPRAGARVLNLLASPLHVRILQAHAEGHLRLAELHERTEWPAQTTLRAAVGTLREFGLLTQRQVSKMPYGIATELTEAGREVLCVIKVVDRWLGEGPQGPIPIDSDAGKAAIKALAGAWSATMIRELAYEPASLTDLDQRIPDMSYPSLERRLSRMRSTRQVEPAAGDGRSQPFEVTDWLRHAIAPLCASARCERRYMREESPPITAIEIEAAFLLTVPIAVLPETATGTCLLSVPADGEPSGDGAGQNLAGASVEVDRGTVVRCVPELERGIPTWALGSPSTWLNAVIDGKLENLRLGGTSPQLAADLAQGIHLALFGR